MNLDDPFNFQLKYLKLIGFNLEFKSKFWNLFWNFYASIIFVSVLAGLIGLILYGYEHLELQHLPNVSSITLSWWTILVRFSVLFAYRQELNDLIFELRKMTKIAISINPSIIKSATRTANIISKVSICLTCLPFTLIMMKTTVQNISSDQRLLPYKISFLLDDQSTPIFVISFIISFIVGFALVIVLPGTAALFVALCKNIVAHLKIIQQVIQVLGSEGQTIEWIVEYHGQIISCVRKVNKIYLIMLNQMSIYYPIIICMMGYDIVTSTSITKMVQQTFLLSAAILGLFQYMYVGNLIIQENAEISRACYEASWIKLPATQKQDILMLMLFSQRRLVIRANFFEISLDTFSNIINATGSYITLLKSFIE